MPKRFGHNEELKVSSQLKMVKAAVLLLAVKEEACQLVAEECPQVEAAVALLLEEEEVELVAKTQLLVH